MSAIILTSPSPSSALPHLPYRQKSSNLNTSSGSGSATAVSEQTPLLRSTPSISHIRSPPLRDTLSTPRFILICAGIWSANFIFAFQTTSIPVLAPGISSGFQHAELAAYLGSVFSLTSTAVIPLYGVFMETLGRRMAMVTAGACFGIGTILCPLSTNIYKLIGARAFAGLGGGGLLTVSSVIVTDLVPLQDRGLYQGIMMTIFGAGILLGGPLAGWLSDQYGWQSSFWVQLPVIAFCITIVSIFLPNSPIAPTHPTLLSGLKSLDWLGTLLLVVSVSTLILGFSFHTSYLEPWSSPVVWGLLVVAAVTLVLFLYVEGKVAKNPIVNLKNLRSKHRSAIMASGFFLSISNGAFMFYVPLYFTVIVNTSTARAGLINSLCGGVGSSAGALLAGQHIRRGGGYRKMGVASLIPPVVGGIVATYWRPDWPWWSYYLTVFPMAFGYSVFLCVQLVALVSGVDSKTMPKATALLYTIRSLGGTIGVSFAGSIQLGTLNSVLRRNFADVPNRDQIIYAVLHSKSAIRQLTPDQEALALDAYSKSLRAVWTATASISLLTVIAALFIQQKETRHDTVKGSAGTGGEGENSEDDD